MALRRRQLARRRKSVGHTQESLAAKLGVDRTTVVRWERAESEPQPWVRPGLADALDVSLDQLADLLTGVEDVSTQQSERLTSVLRSPRTLDLVTIAQLHRAADRLSKEYDVSPSTSLLSPAGTLHNQVGVLTASASGEALRRVLSGVEAIISTLMGQLVWDATQRRDSPTAMAYYDQAIRAAKRNEDPALEAHARLRAGYVALYGDRDPKAGSRYAEHAAQVAARSGSHALHALALLHLGEANAMLGERASCERALSSAERHLGQVTESDPARAHVSAEQLSRLAGSCYLSLGLPRRAQSLLEQAAARLKGRRKSQAIVLGNLALAHLRQGELDNATGILNEAIDTVEAIRGGGAINVLFSATRELQPWRGRPDVQDVTDRTLALMTAQEGS